ncbi:glycerol-3-phosphate acyltransferase [Pseudoramibacter alactolyticus]|uniref:glycerol-3-phosphate acyltransferase n=1 Tax=Pseudoramibacter alactolyticus TaxID=113287 RepID=UPI0028EEFBC9|nr:glycerol-3-phosphate acyltransferase [Pseudoramibacter alactolyticus]
MCGICLMIGYGWGCWLTAAWVARRRGVSIFEAGSGNPGMANVMALWGPGPGLTTLAGDLAKVVAAKLTAAMIFPGGGLTATAWVGLGTVLGHDFPFWHRFRGGKGVAVTGAAAVLMRPGWGFLALGLAALAVIISHYLCVGAVMLPAAFSAPAFYFGGTAIGGIAVAFTLLMLAKNVGGFRRMRRGEEAPIDVAAKLRAAWRRRKPPL